MKLQSNLLINFDGKHIPSENPIGVELIRAVPASPCFNLLGIQTSLILHLLLLLL